MYHVMGAYFFLFRQPYGDFYQSYLENELYP